eukprot:5873287-Prymnesium_polylepis.1
MRSPRPGTDCGSRTDWHPAGEAEGSGARDAGKALRGCGMDDDEDLTIDQRLALDGEGPMSES